MYSPIAVGCRSRWRSPPLTPTTRSRSNPWSWRFPRSNPGAGHVGVSPANCADKAYDQAELRGWLRARGIDVRIARKGIESSEKLGKHRWVIERSVAWLFGYRRLGIRYDRYANHFCAFLTLAATLTCFKKLNAPT
jgi:hypothetical protein